MRTLKLLVLLSIVLIGTEINAQLTTDCNQYVDAYLTTNFNACNLSAKAYNNADPTSPNTQYTFYVNNVPEQGPSNNKNFEHTFPGDGTYTIKVKITETINGATCTDTDSKVIVVDDCDANEPDCCDIDAGFSYSISNCNTYQFSGTNSGTPCPSQTHQWKVDGVVVSNSQNLNYTFSDGTYHVCYTISGVSFVGCSDTYCKTITVDCTPTCPPNGIVINNAECTSSGGGDISANWHVNKNDVKHITWRYSIGPHTNVPIPQPTVGNANGLHQINFNLPQANQPNPGTWDNYVIVVKGIATLTDDTVCDEVYATLTLDCPGGGGGTGGNRSNNNIVLFPNPAKDSFKIESNSAINPETIRIKNTYGITVKTMKYSAKNITISGFKKGIYFVEIVLDNKTIITKKLIIK